MSENQGVEKETEPDRTGVRLGDPIENGEMRDAKGRFVKGHPGMGGRPTGKSKATKLREAILTAIEDMGGAEFVKRAAQEDPIGVLRVAASLVPKELREVHEGSGLVLQILPVGVGAQALPEGAQDVESCVLDDEDDL